MKILIAIMLCLIAGQAIAESDYNSGNYMLPHCKTAVEGKNEDLDVWVGQCAGAIAALQWIGSSIEGEDKFCPPSESTQRQARRIVVVYMDRHPEELHLNYMSLALRALKQAWPCSKRSR